MIIGITNLKGGVGKSTLSQNIAVGLAHTGYRVCILDTDLSQRSSMKWAAQRPDDLLPIPVLGSEGDNVVRDAKEQEKHYDVVIIDGSPQLELAQIKTLAAADVVLVPVSPSALDIWSMQTFLAKYEQVKAAKGDALRGFVVLNKFAGKTRLDKEVAETLVAMGLNVLNTQIADRVVYREAPISGQGVIELNNPKAKEEMQQLVREVIEQF